MLDHGRHTVSACKVNLIKQPFEEQTGLWPGVEHPLQGLGCLHSEGSNPLDSV